MKIIGIASSKTLIATVTKDELANLLGYLHEKVYQLTERDFAIGTEIKIHDMFRQLYDISQSKNQLEGIANQLEHIARDLRISNPVINELAEGPKKIEEVVAKLDNVQ